MAALRHEKISDACDSERIRSNREPSRLRSETKGRSEFRKKLRKEPSTSTSTSSSPSSSVCHRWYRKQGPAANDASSCIFGCILLLRCKGYEEEIWVRQQPPLVVDILESCFDVMHDFLYLLAHFCTENSQFQAFFIKALQTYGRTD